MRVVGLASLLLLCACALSVAHAASDFNQTILIPGYFYPGPLWEQVMRSCPNGTVMIANPNNGPGDAIEQAYIDGIKKAQDPE